ncbi:Vacuolar protein sorting-associated protein 8 central domain [Trinorchestia longiramus]|nr:Vacuolar protein sorting-associated protein 8 central domain [Trinorchestia longiramus]
MASKNDVASAYSAGMDTSDLVHHMERQLQELDATEFELPQVDELPTLESILNEPDDAGDLDSASDSEEPQSAVESDPKTNFSSEAETLSAHSHNSSHGSLELLSSTGSGGSSRQRRSSSSVVRHVALTGIASQLVSAQERSNSGLPTTMAVGSVICVGTSHGLIMVFEPSQALKWCLESHHVGEEYGSVSSLALSEDGTRLLAGYAKGHLCLFDLITGKLMQSIPDAHTASAAVLHLKWTDMPNLAMLSDSGGSVFEVAVKRTMGLSSNMSRCVFTGSRGEVCTVEPLLMSRFNVAPLLQNVIVAMATITKVIVVSLRPSPKVLFSSPLRGSSSSLPLLAWQFVVIQMPDHTRVVDPVLAFGRQNTLYFYQVTHGIGDTLQFLPLRKVTTEYLLHSIAWLNPSTMALLDSSEQCHVMDVRSQKSIESIDLTSLGLVYASQHFKGTATGGNVSKAMAVAGDRACYHSMISFGNQVILLGTRSLQVLTVRRWNERLDQLWGSGQVVQCLQLARQMVKGAAAAVVGLPHRRSRRRAVLQQKITEIVEAILEDWHTSPPTQTGQVVEEMVGACVEVGVLGVVVGRIWDTLYDNTHDRGVFLEALEPWIISGHLPSLPPHISQHLLSHYDDRDKLDALERCIVHLSVPSLDLHQTMTLCRRRGLYDAIIYVYTKGMRDYISPLQELITVLCGALDTCGASLPSAMVGLGNKLLVYVSCCLAGRGYPSGDIEAHLVQQVRAYTCFW